MIIATLRESPANEVVVRLLGLLIFLNFEYRKYGLFFNSDSNGCTHCSHEQEICEVNNLCYFFKKS